MLNWPIVLNQKEQTGSGSITEIVGIKRNEVENKESLLKGHWKRIGSRTVATLKTW